MFSCSSCFAQIIFTGPARICDVTMSHTRISGCHGNVIELKAVSFELFHLFTYNFARFGRFACFGGFGVFVSLVSVVSVVSFRTFRSFRFGRFLSLFQVLVHARAMCPNLKNNNNEHLPVER